MTLEDLRTKPKKKEKSKVLLYVVGIIFSCTFFFSISFMLSFHFITNPVAFSEIFSFNFGSSLEKENQALKEEIESLESKIEQLELTIEKYNYQPSSPVIITADGEEKTEEADSPSSNTENTDTSSESIQKPQGTSSFTPATTVTKPDDKHLSEPASEDITIVEIP